MSNRMFLSITIPFASIGAATLIFIALFVA
jgi:hypothetical protein